VCINRRSRLLTTNCSIYYYIGYVGGITLRAYLLLNIYGENITEKLCIWKIRRSWEATRFHNQHHIFRAFRPHFTNALTVPQKLFQDKDHTVRNSWPILDLNPFVPSSYTSLTWTRQKPAFRTSILCLEQYCLQKNLKGCRFGFAQIRRKGQNTTAKGLGLALHARGRD